MDIITPQEALEKANAGALVVDVRTHEEYMSGHLKGALNVSHEEVAQRISEFGTDTQREILLYCRTGRRCEVAQEILRDAGFSRVINAGGYDDLVDVFNSK